jgi:2-keto-4-pentenoate hydratase/2-oxohepta-3-ene-1,7-dioic acid hydratase in catechol pathway
VAQSTGEAGDVPRLVRFRLDGAAAGTAGGRADGEQQTVNGLLSGSRVAELATGWEDALERWACGETVEELTGRTFEIGEGNFAVPIGEASRGLLCVGMNYRSHRAEVDSSLGRYEAEKPVIFSKLPESLIATDEPLSISSESSSEFDWEVELGVVIGRKGRSVRATEAVDYVSGYTLVNDVTARDVQRAHSQWFLGKNVHRSSPVGPCVVHRDVLGWPPDGRLRLSVNGEVKQDASTLDMVHGVAALIETVSKYVELQVGDIIATGSPAGVGFTRQPPEFLATGDVVRAELVGLLTLENEVQ